jgi:hypothetical protein
MLHIILLLWPAELHEASKMSQRYQQSINDCRRNPFSLPQHSTPRFVHYLKEVQLIMHEHPDQPCPMLLQQM